MLGEVRDFLVEGLLAAGEILELVRGGGGGLIGQGIGEGLLGLLQLFELFDEIIDLALMGLGGGFLQFGMVLDQLIELLLQIALLLLELGIVGVLREGIGELAALFGRGFRGTGPGVDPWRCF